MMTRTFRTEPFDLPGGGRCTPGPGVGLGPVYIWPRAFNAEECRAAYDVMRVVPQQLSNEEMYALIQHRCVERRFDAWMERLESKSS